MEECKTNNIHHCPACGGELQSGAEDHAFECPACEYTEQEVLHE